MRRTLWIVIGICSVGACDRPDREPSAEGETSSSANTATSSESDGVGPTDASTNATNGDTSPSSGTGPDGSDSDASASTSADASSDTGSSTGDVPALQSCADAPWVVCEDFESTDPDTLPDGWSLVGWGDREVVARPERSRSGAQALRIDIPEDQPDVVAMIQRPAGELATRHFGRMYMLLEAPAPTQFVHFDVFRGIGPWDDHTNEARWAAAGSGSWTWYYNVQPRGGGGPEFTTQSATPGHPLVDTWMCLEWFLDAEAQLGQLWQDGVEVENLDGDDERTEIPVFDVLSVGFQKFQTTDRFVVWVDEIALDHERIGCASN